VSGNGAGSGLSCWRPFSYDHMAIEGSSIHFYFTHVETGLAFTGGTGTGFEIAGTDGNYVTATAVIQPDASILVSAPSVTTPKNARYCWAGNPTASLNNQGTPAPNGLSNTLALALGVLLALGARRNRRKSRPDR